MNTTVFDVVHMFSEGGISAVPIIDEDGIVVNLYETVDVIVSHVSMAVLYAVLQEVNHQYHRPSYDSVSTSHWTLRYLRHCTNGPLTSLVLSSALRPTPWARLCSSSRSVVCID